MKDYVCYELMPDMPWATSVDILESICPGITWKGGRSIRDNCPEHIRYVFVYPKQKHLTWSGTPERGCPVQLLVSIAELLGKV